MATEGNLLPEVPEAYCGLLGAPWPLPTLWQPDAARRGTGGLEVVTVRDGTLVITGDGDANRQASPSQQILTDAVEQTLRQLEAGSFLIG